jgi:hypothetical protein
LIDPNPGLADPANQRFELAPTSPAVGAGVRLPGIAEGTAEGTADGPPNLGACPPVWKPGHDFDNPPTVKWEMPEIAFSNSIRNAAFELGTTEFWTVHGPGVAEIGKGNGWGNGFGQGKVQKTGTSKHELKLTGRVRVKQVIENLQPNTKYQLSGWLRVTDEQSPVLLGVTGHGGPDVTVTCADKGWKRKTIDFTTATGVETVTVFVASTSEAGTAFADNLGLPRR